MSKRLMTRKEVLFEELKTPQKLSVYEFRRTRDFVDKRRNREEGLRSDIDFFQNQIQEIDQTNNQYLNQIANLENQYNSLDDWYKRDITGRQLYQQIQGYQATIKKNQQVQEKYKKELEAASQQLEQIAQTNKEIEQRKTEQPDRPSVEKEISPVSPPQQKAEPTKEKSDWKDQRRQQENKIKKEIRKSLKQILDERTKNREPLDDESIMYAALEDESIFAAIADIAYQSQEFYPQSIESALSDARVKKILKDQIQKAKAETQKPGPLYDQSRQKEIADRTKDWNLFDPGSVSQEEYLLGESDEEYQEYKNRTIEENSGKVGDARYRRFVGELGKAYENAKMQLPSKSQWLENIATMPYYEWGVRTGDDKEDFQRWRSQEAELAERIKGAPLSDMERQKLESHLTADNYYSAMGEKDEGTADGVGPGIYKEGEPPANLNQIPLVQDSEKNVYSLLESQGVDINSLSEQDREAISALVEKIHAGQLDQKTAELLKYDPDMKSVLRSAAGRMRRFWGPYISGTAAEDVMSIVDDHLRNINAKDLKGWPDRLQEVNEKWESQDPRIDEKLLASGNKEQYLSNEYKKWLKQKVFESVSRLLRTAMGQERGRDFFKVLDEANDFDAEQMFRDWALGEGQTDKGSGLHKIVQGFLNPERAEEAGLNPAKIKSARLIYELLYNPNSDLFIGLDADVYRPVERSTDERYSPENINWEKVSSIVRQMGRNVSSETLQNYHSNLIRFMKEFAKEAAKNKELYDQAIRDRGIEEEDRRSEEFEVGQRNREQEGFASPTRPAQTPEKTRSRPDATSPIAPSKEEKKIKDRRKSLERLLSKAQRISGLRALSKKHAR